MNLYQIRHNENYYAPDNFKHHGVRGWWIRVLNRARFWLECKVAFHVFVLLSKQESVGPQNVYNSATIRSVAKETTPGHVHLSEPRSKASLPTDASVEGHLKALHRRGSVEHPRDITARAMARYAADPNTRRYAFGRNHRIMMEAETETQETEANGKEESGAQPESHSESPRPARGQGWVRPVHPEYAADIIDPDDFPDSDEEVADAPDDSDEDGPEPEDPIEADRLRARYHISEAAHAATQHQRSVLSREFGSERPVHTDRGPDAERESGPTVPGEESGERGAEEAGTGQVRGEGT
jgi:hypothetical protein